MQNVTRCSRTCITNVHSIFGILHSKCFALGHTKCFSGAQVSVLFNVTTVIVFKHLLSHDQSLMLPVGLAMRTEQSPWQQSELCSQRKTVRCGCKHWNSQYMILKWLFLYFWQEAQLVFLAGDSLKILLWLSYHSVRIQYHSYKDVMSVYRWFRGVVQRLCDCKIRGEGL